MRWFVPALIVLGIVAVVCTVAGMIGMMFVIAFGLGS